MNAPTARSRQTVAVFSTPWNSKFQRLRPLISDLAREGLDVHVFTDRRFAPEVEAAGGSFVDLFGAYPVEAVDDESIPFPCRHVTFAGAYAEPIAADLRRLGPQLIVHDSFSVIGRVVAQMLDLPHVVSCAGHNVIRERAETQYEIDLTPVVSEACRRAVHVLGDTYGLADATPFAYLSNRSPLLNLYGEPAEFLSPDERRAYEPVAFYGSLPVLEEIEARRNGAVQLWPGDAGDTKIYVAFGGFVWSYWPQEVLDAFTCISEAVSGMANVSALIGLGNAQLDARGVRALAKPNVSVVPYVDQWQALAQADLFVTHNGVHSTHEAIYSGVPMLSYPFFGDQPSLAALCQKLGLAVPLADSPRQALTRGRVRAALLEMGRQRESMLTKLEQAQEWELRMLAGRADVVRRIIDLIR